MAIESVLRNLKRLVPAPLFTAIQPLYHYLLAAAGTVLYGFPSRNITVIAVTGTKGKSSTLEYLNSIFETAGHTTALISTIRIKIGNESRPNLYRMTMPGRFFLNKTLRRAVDKRCDIAFVELTSEAAKQYRHKFLQLDALVFTNLSPEHIESHGSMEKYAAAKLELARQVARSKKRPRYIVANADDEYGQRFLQIPVEHRLPYSLVQAEPYRTNEHGGQFRFLDQDIAVHLPGTFSVYNALAAATLAYALGVPRQNIKSGIEAITLIPGRAQEVHAGQPFTVVVDYAHTPDSLRAIYTAYGTRPKICVLGATGGGRDHWKRPEMGLIAEEHCTNVILTNEDPYDEDPEKIVSEIASRMRQKPEIIMDRRLAIRRAIAIAKSSDVVLITGKGTDPNICGPNGEKTPWSDAKVAEEELQAYVRVKTAESPAG